MNTLKTLAKPDGRYLRPERIILRTVDPFDGRVDVEGSYRFDPRLAARGYYTRLAYRLKRYTKGVTGPRTPRVEVRFQYG